MGVVGAARFLVVHDVREARRQMPTGNTGDVPRRERRRVGAIVPTEPHEWLSNVSDDARALARHVWIIVQLLLETNEITPKGAEHIENAIGMHFPADEFKQGEQP
jgi:hypothetical protein